MIDTKKLTNKEAWVERFIRDAIGNSNKAPKDRIWRNMSALVSS